MSRQQFNDFVGWAALSALFFGFALSLPKLASVGVVMGAAWLLARPGAWFWWLFWFGR